MSNMSRAAHWGFLSYVPHDFKLPDALSQFKVGLTDDFSLDSLILHGRDRGWALDSSWRNKNENRAAVTFLIAVDEDLHALPGEHQDGTRDVVRLSAHL